jgi:hypothetical protein
MIEYGDCHFIKEVSLFNKYFGKYNKISVYKLMANAFANNIRLTEDIYFNG